MRRLLAPATALRQRIALILILLLAYGAFAGLRAATAPGGFAGSIVAGDMFVDRTALDRPIPVKLHSAGYDGQFFYRLALDPFTRRAVDHGVTLDHPGLRQQRIGYPLLAHLLSFGDAALVPLVLVALNLAAVGVLGWAATGIATLYGRPAWQGLVIPFYPGLLLSLSRDTAEVVAAAVATLAVQAALRDRYWRAGLLGCGAALTRETTLLYLAGFGLVAAIRALQGRRWDWRIAAFLLPMLTLGVWQALLVATWRESSLAAVGQADLGRPLFYLAAALYRDAATFGAPPFRFDHVYAPLTKLVAIVQVAVVARALGSGRPVDWRLVVPWLLYLALAALFTDAVWIEPYGYLRILVDLYVAGCIVLLGLPGDRAIRGLAIATPIVWAATWPYAL